MIWYKLVCMTLMVMEDYCFVQMEHTYKTVSLSIVLTHTNVQILTVFLTEGFVMVNMTASMVKMKSTVKFIDAITNKYIDADVKNLDRKYNMKCQLNSTAFDETSLFSGMLDYASDRSLYFPNSMIDGMTEHVSWLEAESQCQRNGGHLLSIHSEYEVRRIRKILHHRFIPVVFIGLQTEVILTITLLNIFISLCSNNLSSYTTFKLYISGLF